MLLLSQVSQITINGKKINKNKNKIWIINNQNLDRIVSHHWPIFLSWAFFTHCGCVHSFLWKRTWLWRSVFAEVVACPQSGCQVSRLFYNGRIISNISPLIWSAGSCVIHLNCTRKPGSSETHTVIQQRVSGLVFPCCFLCHRRVRWAAAHHCHHWRSELEQNVHWDTVRKHKNFKYVLQDRVWPHSQVHCWTTTERKHRAYLYTLKSIQRTFLKVKQFAPFV